MHFAKQSDLNKVTCNLCRAAKRIPTQESRRRCKDDGFENKPEKGRDAKGWSVDNSGAIFPFCPGKATWYPHIQDVFQQCKIAYLTGHLPEEGGLYDQGALFASVYSTFVERWQERKLRRVWDEVYAIVPKAIESLVKGVLSPFTK